MNKKLASFLLLTVIFISAIFSTQAADSITFTITDPKTDICYDVENNDGYISVKHNSTILCTTFIKNADAYSLYDGVLTIYAVDNLNNSLMIYSFDFLNDTTDTFAFCCDAYLSKYCFTINEKGNIYFVSNEDTKHLCESTEGEVKKIDLKAQISQLLCVDGDCIIVITSQCTYIYRNSTVKKALDYPLSFPAKYTECGVITDASGKEYTIDGFAIKDKLPDATEAECSEYTQITETHSDTYIAESGTTVSKIKKAFADLKINEVRKADGKIINSGRVGTGTTLHLSSGQIITVIICGEVTGEGNINSRDLTAVLNHLSRKELLSGSFLTAADADNDGEITTKDALIISLMY
ncbi:MAG: dockerin type I domain-containing protein [Ruminococcus sp.]|nr:dockerin type I domain-containing protein [Ruminococcus sp.]